MRLIYLLISMLILIQLSGQSTDIKGNVKIRGKIDLLESGGTNLIIGANAGRKALGHHNLLIGSAAGEYLDTSYNNTIIGYDAGLDITDVTGNTFLGFESCYDCKGDHNTLLGQQSGSYLEGDYNVAIGTFAGLTGPLVQSSSTGNYNVFVGSNANTASGAGDYNTLIGYRSRTEPDGQDSIVNGIAIGARSDVACSNCAVIGGTGGYAVKLGIGTDMPTRNLSIHDDVSVAVELKINDSEEKEVLLGMNESSDAWLRTITNHDLSFWTNNKRRITVENSGEVGVGIISPLSQFHLHGISTETPLFRITNGGNTNGGFEINATSSTLINGLMHYKIINNEDGGLHLGANNKLQLFIAPDGNIGIGVINPTTKLDIDGSLKVRTLNMFSSGNAVVENGGTFGVLMSDRRLKKDIRPIEDALTKLSTINGVSYTAISEQYGDQKVRQLGVIAQTVKKTIPDATFEHNGYLGVEYTELIPVLINAINEQQEIIKNMREDIEHLKLATKSN